ncbi:helix-turn-helix domain-containing protein [Nocardioides sp. InS609-2]|uniref:helix-turn-helix domain-containing protein n=1 Tax=Nocardioides sp. InS609-2 TaxID=2760705 RepID=UPI0020C169B6|nr:helix-turn-helix domain-containing protein [Nocardioides sp. InS609-2]
MTEHTTAKAIKMSAQIHEVADPSLLVSDPLMTIDDAAAYLAIPKSTLYTWRTRRAGFGPKAVKVGGSLRYRRSALNAWIEANSEELDLDEGLEVLTDDGQERNISSAPVALPSTRGKASSTSALPSMTRKRTRRS